MACCPLKAVFPFDVNLKYLSGEKIVRKAELSRKRDIHILTGFHATLKISTVYVVSTWKGYLYKEKTEGSVYTLLVLLEFSKMMKDSPR